MGSEVLMGTSARGRCHCGLQLPLWSSAATSEASHKSGGPHQDHWQKADMELSEAGGMKISTSDLSLRLQLSARKRSITHYSRSGRPCQVLQMLQVSTVLLQYSLFFQVSKTDRWITSWTSPRGRCFGRQKSLLKSAESGW